MSNLQLTELEIRDLLNRYRSEMRKLEFQMRRIQSTVEDLSEVLGEEPPTAPVRTASSSSTTKKRGPGRPPKKKKRGPGRPPKSESSKRGPGRPPKKKRGPGRPPKKRGPGRPPKSKNKSKRGRKKGSYRLSDWDKFILNTVDNADKPLINSELFDRAQEWDTAKDMSDDDVKQYISRSIHKLANKHKTLNKVPYEGRGYAYATDKMVFNNGKLKKEYSR
jgi:hypothetical protein